MRGSNIWTINLFNYSIKIDACKFEIHPESCIIKNCNNYATNCENITSYLEEKYAQLENKLHCVGYEKVYAMYCFSDTIMGKWEFKA